MFVTEERAGSVLAEMFFRFGSSEEERFLQKELSRYVPQFVRMRPDERQDFAAYEHAVRIGGKIPQIGRPIASLNPIFTQSIDCLKFNDDTYVRASTKVNGYRMQIHRGPNKISAFTRQFMRYDLRMFPELTRTLESLPVMIGDAELVCKRYKHHAGFNRLREKRIPSASYWPRWGEDKISDEFLSKLFSDRNTFSENNWPLDDVELEIVFHGLFAISHPRTWGKSLEEQEASLITLAKLPVDYREIDRYLTHLDVYLSKIDNARVVGRFQPRNYEELASYISKNEEAGEEGTCVVESIYENGRPILAGRSIKIKTYEPVDMAVLGFCLKKKDVGLKSENVSAMICGLFDQSLGEYMPAARVNLDPDGPQIKLAWQRDRLVALRDELVSLATSRVSKEAKLLKLTDVYRMQGARVIQYLKLDDELTKDFENTLDLLSSLPRGYDLVSLHEKYMEVRLEIQELILKGKKPKTVLEKFLVQNANFFEAVCRLDRVSYRRFTNYFSKDKDIRDLSAKAESPQVVLDTNLPILVEVEVFKIEWGASPYPAGFHSWFCQSFVFENLFPSHLRMDKSSTTDFRTIHEIARTNCGRTLRQRNKK